MTESNGIILNSANLESIKELARNLENLTMRMETGVSEGNDMLQRTRVLIGQHDSGEPIYKQLKAQSIDLLNDRIVQTYIDSGRIWEFMPRDGKPQTKTLFQPFAEEWFKRFKSVPNVKPRTEKTYRDTLRAAIFPAFGNRIIEEITAADIQDFLNQQCNDGMKKKTINGRMNLLSQIFRWAQECKLIESNPMKSMTIKNPSKETTSRKVFTTEQFITFLRNLFQLPEGRERLMGALITFTGMRRDELLGLKWEDIDWNQRVIHIQRGVKHIGNRVSQDDFTTKSDKGIRDIYFDNGLYTLIHSLQGTGYVFGGESPYTKTQYDTVRKHFFKAINTYGVTEHGIRHSYLSELNAHNVDPKTLQAIAGHADIQTTLNIYVHEKAEKKKEAGVMIDRLLYGYATEKPDYASASCSMRPNAPKENAAHNQ